MDKWICIRKRFSTIVGFIYELEKINESSDEYFVFENESPVDIISDSIVRKYFIPLSEWREKQIKSLFDE